MIETIADIRKREVFTNFKPHKSVVVDQETHDTIFNEGWNAAVAFYKELGKI